MVTAVTLIVFVVVLWACYLWSLRKYYAFAGKMTGPRGLPIIGIVHKVYKMSDILYSLPKYAAQFKVKTFFSWVGTYPAIYTMDPKFAEIILNSPDCLKKSEVYDVISDVTGKGLLTSGPPRWNKHRKLINPSFSYKALLEFFPNFNKFAKELCEVFEEHTNRGEIDVKELLFGMTLKSSVDITMGVDLDQESDTKFLTHFERLVEITTQRALKPWLSNSTLFRFMSMYKPFKESQTYINDFVYKIVTSKLDENNNLPDTRDVSKDLDKKNHNFIDQFIKIYEKNEFIFDDVIQEANTLLVAAFETQATTIFSTLLCLAMHPKYQDIVFEEIISVFPEGEDNVTNADLKNLVYLDMCIDEAMRVQATIPLIIRECTSDVVISKDVVIPKGTQIIVDIFNIHRDKDTWGPDANTYNPDHFLPENLAGLHKYSFLPYSKGPRICIGWQYAGMVVKVVLAHLLRKYRFSTEFRFEDLKYIYHGTVKYQDLPNLEVHRR